MLDLKCTVVCFMICRDDSGHSVERALVREHGAEAGERPGRRSGCDGEHPGKTVSGARRSHCGWKGELGAVLRRWPQQAMLKGDTWDQMGRETSRKTPRFVA